MSVLNPGPVRSRIHVNYDNLGPLNTKRDAHALLRGELSQSVNLWSAKGNALSKRPGSTAFGTLPQSTGSGIAGKGLAAGRFSGATQVIVQQGTSVYAAKSTDVAWTNIGTLGTLPGSISCAQMYDSDTGFDQVFLCDGVDTPKTWKGPGFSLASALTTAGKMPTNMTGGAPITPKYVATVGNNSHLFYAGEPTFPNGVFISDAFFPQRFTVNSSASSPYGGSYLPYIVGLNDGVDGGDITGLKGLQSCMMVYKQAAIYRMDEISLYGDSLWKSSLVSASVGCLSPKSIVAFDTFHCFLGIDGVYQTDGMTTRCISANVPTYFDSSLTGVAASITDRTTAVAVRSGNRYLIWFDTLNSGHPTTGLWFDFNKPDADGLPCAGEISNMTPVGAVSLRGAGDDGTFVWIDGTADSIGKFGIGYADFGNAIPVSFFGKADDFLDYFGPTAPVSKKKANRVYLAMSVPSSNSLVSLTVTAACITDDLSSTSGASAPILVQNSATGQWGQQWGTMTWNATNSNGQYFVSEVQSQAAALGRILQFGFQESSTNPLTFLGYVVDVNDQGIAA